MASNKPLVLPIQIEGARETLAAFRKLPKEASAELRAAALEISTDMAAMVSQAALSQGPQTALMAPTVKARRDRVPVIEVGGNQRVGRNNSPAWGIVFGAEFGAGPGTRGGFRPHRGRAGYFIFPTIEAAEGLISARWQTAADNITAEYAAGPGPSTAGDA